jgi:N-acetylneuraminic acid mutarotase
MSFERPPIKKGAFRAKLLALLGVAAIGCGSRTPLSLEEAFVADAAATLVFADAGAMSMRSIEPSPDARADLPDVGPCMPNCRGVACGAPDGCGGKCDRSSCSDCCSTEPATAITVFGGSDAARRLGDTWEWGGSAWMERKVPGPSPRGGAAMASLDGKVILFGGYAPNDQGPAALGDTWEWDGASWSPRDVPGPSPRWSGAAAMLKGKVVLFGGYSGTSPLGDTWEWDGSSWTERKVPGPPARNFHAMAAVADKIVLFGGQGSIAFGDTWEWDGNSWTQRSPSRAPDARSDIGMATLGGKVVLFGGTGQGRPSDETWEWDGASWTERMVAGPRGRVAFGMAALAGRVVLFGGNTLEGSRYVFFSDTWEWDSNVWSQRNVQGPTMRNSVAMASR